jgi:hypothetical protein
MDTNLRSVLLIAVSVIMAAPLPVSSQTLAVEAEDYVSAHDEGGVAIQPVPGSSCSSGYLLVGLDFTGDWAEYDLSVADFGWYSFEIRCRGVFNQAYVLRLVFTPAGSGETQSVEFSFTGAGYG